MLSRVKEGREQQTPAFPIFGVGSNGADCLQKEEMIAIGDYLKPTSSVVNIQKKAIVFFNRDVIAGDD